MKNNARKMAMENQIDLVQQNAIDFTHACMTIALHEVFGVGKERLDKVTRRKDEINGELMRRMALPAPRCWVSDPSGWKSCGRRRLQISAS